MSAKKPRKPVKPKVAAETPTTPTAEPVEAIQATPVVEEAQGVGWTWTEAKLTCLERIFQGASQRRIADELGVHYNTIGNWTKHPLFHQRLAELSNEQAQAVRLRRIQETNVFTTRIAKLADKTLTTAEEHPESLVAAEKARAWLSAYTEFRAEERVNSGENVQHLSVSGVVGHVHAGVRQASFRDFLTTAVEKGVIDTTAIELTGDANDVIVSLVQAALREGDVLDVVTEEDRQQALADGVMS